ncbi:hypothetical protein [Jeongeupia naejangsanensis]|uniref:Lipoprotein n=1 Tax=Jeongeupia naejangsanensis TaxID=613195 RepID=A0ABS2BJH3_9NEIS|nr:hypothetical protein [Jeongeupia naejangsanensis]MBM3115738.1 hypothetical protein [Jeongeupia naejangsanensis]
MTSRLLMLLACALLSACASVRHQPLSSTAAPLLENKSLAFTTGTKPDFTAMTAGNAMFGLIGAIEAVSSGNALIRDNAVPDPASGISAELAKMVHAQYRIADRKLGVVSTAAGVDELAKLHPDVDLLLDVRTANWSLIYFPADWTHYRVIYSAQARLINLKQREVLAEHFCEQVPEQTADAPTYDELVGNGAAGLKQALSAAGDKCLEEFASLFPG